MQCPDTNGVDTHCVEQIASPQRTTVPFAPFGAQKTWYEDVGPVISHVVVEAMTDEREPLFEQSGLLKNELMKSALVAAEPRAAEPRRMQIRAAGVYAAAAALFRTQVPASASTNP